MTITFRSKPQNITTILERLETGVSLQSIASAVETQTIYGLDSFGRVIRATTDSKDKNGASLRSDILKALAYYYKYLSAPEPDLRQIYHHKLASSGWPTEDTPDFATIHESWKKQQNTEGLVIDQAKTPSPQNAVWKMLKAALAVQFGTDFVDHAIGHHGSENSQEMYEDLELHGTMDIKTFRSHIKRLPLQD